MKLQQPHPTMALSAARVRSIAEPGRYADGNGLYLVVDPTLAKRWMLRTMVHGRRRDIGLGGLKVVSLAEARSRATELRGLARIGGDPIAERKKQSRTIPSFEEAAKAVHLDREATWKNGKHAAQWLTTLSAYVFPSIGSLRVDHIDTPAILKALAPIWLSKPETARRVRQRVSVVMDWAIASGFRSGENPVKGVTKGLPKQGGAAKHHRALPYAEVGAFLNALHASDEGQIAQLAFEFLILTATRTNEVLGATWAEINLAKQVWTIPADRMKAGREHRVPLPPRCLEILASARKLSADGKFLFPGRIVDRPLSNMALLMILRRLEIDATAHGFRSSFRDWAFEKTNFPREVCEAALAHTVRDKSEAAYRRGDGLDKRRLLMTAWASFVLGQRSKVVALRTA